jgi:hypothetical protein
MQMTLSSDSGVVMSAASTLMRPPDPARPAAAPSPFGAVVQDGRDWSSRPHSEDVIVDYGGFRQTRTVLQILTSLAGAIGIASLVPIGILILGIPIALAVRGLAEAAQWLGAALLN